MSDVLFLNNAKISEFINLIYPCEHEIKDTTESNTSVSYLDYLCTDSGKLVTMLYNKRNDFNFPIVLKLSIFEKQYSFNTCIRHLCLSASSLCYSLLQISKISLIGKLLTNKLLSQDYRRAKLVSTVKLLWETS